MVDDVTVSSGPCSGEVVPTPGEGKCEYCRGEGEGNIMVDDVTILWTL